MSSIGTIRAEVHKCAELDPSDPLCVARLVAICGWLTDEIDELALPHVETRGEHDERQLEREGWAVVIGGELVSRKLAVLAKECAYSDDPDEDCGVDALIAYKDALEATAGQALAALIAIRDVMYGPEYGDPDREWTPGTLDDVAEIVRAALPD